MKFLAILLLVLQYHGQVSHIHSKHRKAIKEAVESRLRSQRFRLVVEEGLGEDGHLVVRLRVLSAMATLLPSLVHGTTVLQHVLKHTARLSLELHHIQR